MKKKLKKKKIYGKLRCPYCKFESILWNEAVSHKQCDNCEKLCEIGGNNEKARG